jgi:hypothetical protein
MLKIGEGQAKALRSASLADYVDRLIAHLRRVFPEDCNAMGEGALRTLIDAGMTKAKSYGFVSELEICKYIDLMMVYGSDFEIRAPWAAVFSKANDRRAFEQAFDEQYDALLES